MAKHSKTFCAYGAERPLRVLSLGAGVQSTVMLLMAARGEIHAPDGSPLYPDVAIFADTGWEPDHVYRHLEWLEAEVLRMGADGTGRAIPIVHVSRGNLRQDTIDFIEGRRTRAATMPVYVARKRVAYALPDGRDLAHELRLIAERVDGIGVPEDDIPLLPRGHAARLRLASLIRERRSLQRSAVVAAEYKSGEGMVMRQCTREYKVEPIDKEIKRMLGVRRAPERCVEKWLGISMDEILRMKSSTVAWAVNRWPLIEAEMTRQDCLSWLADNGYPIAPKSSCIGCPYHSDRTWRELKDRYPEAWQDAVEFDEILRRHPRMRGEPYLHRQMVPLAEVDLRTAFEKGQFDLFDEEFFDNECEGICGV
jgi:hypothetical protein